MQTDLISVIVPVYKVEEYLCECLDSIINQTYKNLEIILVDDGSPDNCGKICDEYALKDSRIKVIHQQNGGLSAARNAGLDIANGDYIGFVDSDDYIELNMYEELYNSLNENNADMSACGIECFGLKNKTESYGNRVLNNPDFLKLLLKDEITSYAVNKLYKKKLFSDIRFPAGKKFEDMAVLHLVAEKSSSTAATDKTFYNYRIRKNSITSSGLNSANADHMEAAHSRTERYKDTDYYIFAVTGEFKCLRQVVSDMSIVKQDKESYKKLFKESKQLYKICKKQLSFFQRMISVLFFVSPKLHYSLKRLVLQKGLFN